VGGEAVTNLTAEYRFPVYSTAIPGRIDEQELVRGRLFVDMGTLGLDASDPSFHEVRVGAGVGLSIRLPIFPLFPIALDFAFPVAREETDDVQAFSFSIGNF
jgi:outer membrane protein insertion porin family